MTPLPFKDDGWFECQSCCFRDVIQAQMVGDGFKILIFDQEPRANEGLFRTVCRNRFENAVEPMNHFDFGEKFVFSASALLSDLYKIQVFDSFL